MCSWKIRCDISRPHYQFTPPTVCQHYFTPPTCRLLWLFVYIYANEMVFSHLNIGRWDWATNGRAIRQLGHHIWFGDCGSRLSDVHFQLNPSKRAHTWELSHWVMKTRFVSTRHIINFMNQRPNHFISDERLLRNGNKAKVLGIRNVWIGSIQVFFRSYTCNVCSSM